MIVLDVRDATELITAGLLPLIPKPNYLGFQLAGPGLTLHLMN